MLNDDSNVTHGREELTILSFLVVENLLSHKRNNLEKLMFTETSNKDNGMLYFSFVLLSLMLTLV